MRALRAEPISVSYAQVYDTWLAERQVKGQSNFMPLYLQRMVVISDLLYCRCQKMHAGLLEGEYQQEISRIKEALG